MMAARVLAYGAEYQATVEGPDGPIETTFDLTKVNYKPLPKDVKYDGNEFTLELPASKVKVTFKLLNGNDEANINRDLAAINKTGSSADITTRLRYMIIAVDGKKDKKVISTFVNNMLSQDSLALRTYYNKIAPDVEMDQEMEIGGEMVKVTIPMTVRFFWPDSTI